MLSTILGVLGGGEGFGGGESEGGGESSIVNNVFNSGNYGLFNDLKNNTTNPAKPRAFLNYLVFDEEFNLNETVSGSRQASGHGAWATETVENELIADHPGYVLFFTDNTTSMDVYWDQTTVTVSQGQVLEEDHYYPFGLTLSENSYFPLDKNKYKLTTKELQSDFGLNYYDFGARMYDMQIGRWTSVDPMAHVRNWLTPYNYVSNNPITRVDPTGELDGDYYDTDGQHLGNDGIDDDKVYVASGKTVCTNDDGTTSTTFNDAQELSISHTEFREQAATIYGESSAYKMSTVTDDLKKEMFSIAYVHLNNKTAYGISSNKAKEYLKLTPSAINKSAFKTTANAAIINAQTGGFDYSFGASMWDGREQSLFPASDNRGSTGTWELHMNTMGWSISDNHYQTWKTNVGSSFLAPQQKAAPANFGNYKNMGLMRLKSTAVYGETIFWKVK